MIGFIFTLTLRQLLSRRSTLLMAGLAAVPVLLALVYRLSDPDNDPERWTARVLFFGLTVTAVLPLTALLFGTSVLGDELEDGTAVYLLTKPIKRWQILLPKLAAAWVVTAAMLVTSTVASGLLALEGNGDASMVIGFAVAVAVGALAYACVFVLLSVITTRALIMGLIYVFLWEGAITGIFHGTRYLSIRHYTIGLADWLGDVQPSAFVAYLSGTTALVMTAITIVIAVVMAVRKLEEIEVRETT